MSIVAFGLLAAFALIAIVALLARRGAGRAGNGSGGEYFDAGSVVSFSDGGSSSCGDGGGSCDGGGSH